MDVVTNLLKQWKHERPDLDASAMGVVGRVLRLGSILEVRASAAVRPYAISYTDLDVLATLRRSGAPYLLRPSQLQHSVLISSGAMTACLNRLETLALIGRKACDDDRRSLGAFLTVKGKQLVDRAIKDRFHDASDAIGHLNSAERRQLEKLLQKMEAGLEQQRQSVKSELRT